jgi:hypothetical protein
VLRFGRYLYSRRLISREMLDDALAWQKNSRPRMGQIAMREGMISPREFALLVSFLREGRLFGEVATRRHLLEGMDIARLKIAQASYDRPLGRFFVVRGVLDERQLETYHRAMITHNVRFAA